MAGSRIKSLSRTTTPRLATIDQNFAQFTQLALDSVCRQIETGVRTGGTVVVSNRFMPRASCGAQEAPDNDGAALILRNDADAYANEIGIAYEVTKDLISANFIKVLRRMWVLAPYLEWACIGEWNDFSEHTDRLQIRDVLDLQETGQHPLLNSDIKITQFPPLQQLPDDMAFANRFITVVPVIFEKKWTVLTVTGLFNSEAELARYPTLMHYIDLLGLALERSMIDEEALQRESRYRQLAEQLEIVSRTSNDGIWEWNFRARRIEWNDRFYALLGMVGASDNPSTQQPRWLRRHIHPADWPRLRRALRQHLRQHWPFELELKLAVPRGGWMWLAVTGEVLYDAQNQPIKMISPFPPGGARGTPGTAGRR
ncbi:MAG: PAS domain-containing protein, partial [Pseudomonadota bacterium]